MIILSQAPQPVVIQPVVVITRGDVDIIPTIVDGYESTHETRSIVHQILGRPDPDVTLRPAGLRTGTLRLVFADEFAAADAETEFGVGGVFTFHPIERETLPMDFVPTGRVTRTLDDQTRRVWIVAVDFHEV